MQLPYTRVELGVIELKQPINKFQQKDLNKRLNNWDLSIIENPNKVLVERIKNSVINMVHNDAEIPNLKISYFLSSYLNHSYTYMSNIFTRETGMCLRDYIIAHKIERVKEMLITDQLQVSEIAWKMQYSSVAHLSSQFTRVTGLTPTMFKKNPTIPLIPRDKIGLKEAV